MWTGRLYFSISWQAKRCNGVQRTQRCADLYQALLFFTLFWRTETAGTGKNAECLSVKKCKHFYMHLGTHQKTKKYDKYGVSAIFIVYIKSAGDGTWTHTTLLPQAPEACASANSTTPASKIYFICFSVRSQVGNDINCRKNILKKILKKLKKFLKSCWQIFLYLLL